MLVQVQGETAAEDGIHPQLPPGCMHIDSGKNVPTVWGWCPVDIELHIEIGQATTNIEINPQSRLPLRHELTGATAKRLLPDVIQPTKFDQGRLAFHM